MPGPQSSELIVGDCNAVDSIGWSFSLAHCTCSPVFQGSGVGKGPFAPRGFAVVEASITQMPSFAFHNEVGAGEAGISFPWDVFESNPRLGASRFCHTSCKSERESLPGTTLWGHQQQSRMAGRIREPATASLLDQGSASFKAVCSARCSRMC